MDEVNLKSPKPRRKRLPTIVILLGTVFLFSIYITIFNQAGLFSGHYLFKSENDDDFTNSIEGSFASDGESDDGNQNEVNNDIAIDVETIMKQEKVEEKEKESSEDDYYVKKDAQEDINEKESKKENKVEEKVETQTIKSIDVDKIVGNEKVDESSNQKEEKIPYDTSKQRMNILILYPDDWRHDSLGSEKPYVLTPFLDSLAREGIRFTHNAVTTSVCWMSRATLWTGQYSSRHKSYKLKCPRFGTPENWEHSWVKILQRRGYFVAHIGKWQYLTYKTKKYFDWSRLFEGHHWVKVFGGRTVHASDLAAEHAMQFFKDRPKDKPFSLSIAFYPPKAVGNGRAPGHQFSPTNETKKLYENVTIPEPETKKSFQSLPEFLHKGELLGYYSAEQDC